MHDLSRDSQRAADSVHARRQQARPGASRRSLEKASHRLARSAE